MQLSINLCNIELIIPRTEKLSRTGRIKPGASGVLRFEQQDEKCICYLCAVLLPSLQSDQKLVLLERGRHSTEVAFALLTQGSKHGSDFFSCRDSSLINAKFVGSTERSNPFNEVLAKKQKSLSKRLSSA